MRSPIGASLLAAPGGVRKVALRSALSSEYRRAKPSGGLAMPAITGIAHVELSVRDLDTSSEWYCQLLGAREVFREPNEAENLVACAVFEPNSRLVLAFTQHLAPTEGSFDVRRVGLDHVSFAVADRAALEAWAARLDELNVPNSGIQDIGYAQSITFADPDGIPLEFFLQVRR